MCFRIRSSINGKDGRRKGRKRKKERKGRGRKRKTKHLEVNTNVEFHVARFLRDNQVNLYIPLIVHD